MSFEYPGYLQAYLDKKGRSPFENFINSSQYYANTDVYLMTYLDRVVRQCMAYACGSHDGAYNGGISMNVGYTAVKNATKLIKGDKTLFAGADAATAFLSDSWLPKSQFDIFLDEVITYTLQGGTALMKLNKDAFGRCSLSASRVDRNLFSANDSGDVTEAVFFLTLLSSTKNGNDSEQLWLVERRYYEDGAAKVVYHVHFKSGIAGNETLPLVHSEGIPYDQLPESAKITIRRKGIELDKPLDLPFRDGLGVWISLNTATNSCVPGLRMGDPALYGSLDILWAIDTVFSGSIIDVLNGKGVILVPRRFLQSMNAEISKAVGKDGVYLKTHDDLTPPNDNFVYVTVEGEETFIPQSVQFDIRSEQYRGMLEMYLKQFAVSFGYAPTTLFPYLQDVSPKTAREVTAEENLTRASVQSAHRLLIPELNRAISEVLYQHGFEGNATIQLSDYIGNKLMRDENIRQNYAASLIPKETAVQIVNGLSAKETEEYMLKIKNDESRKNDLGLFNDKDYFGDQGGGVA